MEACEVRGCSRQAVTTVTDHSRIAPETRRVCRERRGIFERKASKCLEKGCQRKAFARGLCRKHYDRHRNAGTLEQTGRPSQQTPRSKPKLCQMDECNEVATATWVNISGIRRKTLAVCEACRGKALSAARRAHDEFGGKCIVDGCDAKAVVRGLCEKHYEKARRAGALEDWAAPKPPTEKPAPEPPPEAVEPPKPSEVTPELVVPPLVEPGPASKAVPAVQQDGAEPEADARDGQAGAPQAQEAAAQPDVEQEPLAPEPSGPPDERPVVEPGADITDTIRRVRKLYEQRKRRELLEVVYGKRAPKIHEANDALELLSDFILTHHGGKGDSTIDLVIALGIIRAERNQLMAAVELARNSGQRLTELATFFDFLSSRQDA